MVSTKIARAHTCTQGDRERERGRQTKLKDLIRRQHQTVWLQVKQTFNSRHRLNDTLMHRSHLISDDS